MFKCEKMRGCVIINKSNPLVVILQVITTIPTHRLPQCMSHGRITEKELEEMGEQEKAEVAGEEVGKRGQILWIRGLTRLQHQVSSSLCF